MSTSTFAVGDAPDQTHDGPPLLRWTEQDWEQRLGFAGGRFTRVNGVLSILLAIALSVAFYAALWTIRDSTFARMFLERGAIPYAIVFFSMWSVAILFAKWRKLILQRAALRQSVLPDARDFVLSPTTVDEVLARLHAIADEPQRFVLLNRIQIALSNLRNLGRVTDVDEILRTQAEHDEAVMETSYSLLRGFVWAIPVLGFIGTVLGLSLAIGTFGEILEQTDDMTQITSSLRGVTGGLAIAFETTLEALVAALAIQLTVTVLHKKEEEFLDSCREYCQRHIVGRLRMTPFEDSRE